MALQIKVFTDNPRLTEHSVFLMSTTNRAYKAANFACYTHIWPILDHFVWLSGTTTNLANSKSQYVLQFICTHTHKHTRICAPICGCGKQFFSSFDTVTFAIPIFNSHSPDQMLRSVRALMCGVGRVVAIRRYIQKATHMARHFRPKCVLDANASA